MAYTLEHSLGHSLDHSLEHFLGFRCACRVPAQPIGRAFRRRVFHAIGHAIGWFWLCNRQRRQRQALLDLDDRLLADIGITREAAVREASRPFWGDAATRRPFATSPTTRTMKRL